MDFIFQWGSLIITPVHVVVCLILIAVVLLQTGKGTDWAGVFGGQGTQAAFGPRGVENTLSRLTKIAAVVFMLSSLALSIVKSGSNRGSLGDLPEKGKTAKPKASPTAPPPASSPLAPLASPAPGSEPAAFAPAAPAESPAATPGAGAAPAASPVQPVTN